MHLPSVCHVAGAALWVMVALAVSAAVLESHFARVLARPPLHFHFGRLEAGGCVAPAFDVADSLCRLRGLIDAGRIGPDSVVRPGDPSSGRPSGRRGAHRKAAVAPAAVGLPCSASHVAVASLAARHVGGTVFFDIAEGVEPPPACASACTASLSWSQTRRGAPRDVVRLRPPLVLERHFARVL